MTTMANVYIQYKTISLPIQEENGKMIAILPTGEHREIKPADKCWKSTENADYIAKCWRAIYCNGADSFADEWGTLAYAVNRVRKEVCELIMKGYFIKCHNSDWHQGFECIDTTDPDLVNGPNIEWCVVDESGDYPNPSIFDWRKAE